MPELLLFFCGGAKTASVYEVWRYYNSLGCVYNTPKVGDLAIVSTNNGGTYGHVGIVKTVTSSEIITIDGNSGDAVRTSKRSNWWEKNVILQTCLWF